MGKWDKLKGKLPWGSPLSDKKGFADRVQELRAQNAGRDMKGLIKALAEARREGARLDDLKTDCNALDAALSMLLIDLMDAHDFSSVRTEEHGLVRVAVEPYCSVQDKGLFEGHVESRPELDYMWSVNYQTLNSFVKELYESGRDGEVPPGVGVFLKSKVSFNK